MRARGKAMPTTTAPPPWSITHIDVTAYLSIWVFFLFAISARQVVPGFGAIGSPALLLLLPAGLWWLTARCIPSLDIDREPRVIRKVLLLYGWYMLLTYAMARTRQLTELEGTGSTRAAILMLGLVSLSLLVADGMPSLDRLRMLLRRTVWGTAFLAVIGILQFVSGAEWQFTVPGLTWNGESFGAGVETRSDLNRPRGTALHPIEFSVVTAAMLPISIHLAAVAERGPSRQRAILAAVTIGLAMPLSLSRSGIVALAVVFCVMFIGWTWRQRLNGLVVLAVSVPILWLVVPGLVGTLRAMFSWFDEDPSIQARRDRVPQIMTQFRQEPWFGLGNGTWSLDDYFLLDNQFYVTLLEGGIFGVLAIASVIVVAFTLGMSIRHRPSATPADADLGRALAAAIAGITLSVFTFDAFHYRILTGILFLFIGAIAALIRLTGTETPSAPVAEAFNFDGRSARARQPRI